MTAASIELERTTNLLGTLALCVADQIVASTNGSTERSTSDTQALAAMARIAPGLSQDKLGALLGLSQSAVTRLVDRLVGDGLASRGAGPDGRTVALTATPRGTQIALSILESRSSVVGEVLDVLDPVEQQTLAALLEKLLAGEVNRGSDPVRLCRLCNPAVCHDSGRCPVTDAADALRAGRGPTDDVTYRSVSS